MNKKAQGWGIDLIIAFIIFLTGIFFIYSYTINLGGSSDLIIKQLNSEGKSCSTLILSEGTPKKWDGLENTEIPGIISDRKINQTKLEKFANITDTEEEYVRTKNRLGIKNEFYFNFTGMEIQGEKIKGIGKKPQGITNIIKIERITIYKNQIKKFNLYIWN